jgi:tetratricopeptide (TPR) repeat protein
METVNFKDRFELGRQTIKQGDYSRALELFQSVVDNTSSELELVKVEHHIGYCLLKVEKFKEAESYLKRALGLGLELREKEYQDAELLDIGLHLVQSQFHLGDYQSASEAVRDCDKLLTSFGGKSWLLLRFEFLMAKSAVQIEIGLYTESLQTLKLAKRTVRLLDSNPSKRMCKTEIAYRIGETHLKLDHPRRATRQFSRVDMELLHTSLLPAFILSWILAESKKSNYHQVLTLYDKYKEFAEVAKQKDMLYYLLGDAHYWLGQGKPAKEFFEKLLTVTESDFYINRSKEYLKSIENTKPRS